MSGKFRHPLIIFVYFPRHFFPDKVSNIPSNIRSGVSNDTDFLATSLQNRRRNINRRIGPIRFSRYIHVGTDNWESGILHELNQIFITIVKLVIANRLQKTVTM